MVKYKKAVVKASCGLCFSTPLKSFLADETPRGINATWTRKNIFFRLSKVWILERALKCAKVWFFCFSTDCLSTRVLKQQAYMFISTIMFVPVKAENWQCWDDSLQLISFWNWVLMEPFQTMLRQNLLLPRLSYWKPFLCPFAESSGLFVRQHI